MFGTKQCTINNVISFEGIGLHNGKKTNVRLIPAENNHGILFKRTDITYQDNLIKAHYKNVTKVNLGTTIANQDNVSISTIEHFMAALWGSRIDNLLIEIDNEEMPIMDGSSEPFVFLLESAGIKTQSSDKKIIKITKEVSLIEGDKSIILSPSDKFLFDLEIDFGNKFGTEKISFNPKYHSFRSDLCRARTFAFEKDVEQIKKLGLGKGGSLDNAIIIGENDILNKDGLRYKNELARHKALDFIGDLYLTGYYIIGHFKVIKPGHNLNNKFLYKLESKIKQ